MPRPAPVPLKGKFDSRTGIYSFEGYSYKPRWYANALQMPINDCKSIIEQGHQSDMQDYPQAVLVVGKTKWEQIAKSYQSWVGMAQFHYYAPDVNPGELPAWLHLIKAHGTKLIHEIRPGEVYLLTYFEPDFIYRYFIDSAPAPTYAPAPGGAPGDIPALPPSPVLTFSELDITGSIGDTDIDLLLKFK